MPNESHPVHGSHEQRQTHCQTLNKELGEGEAYLRKLAGKNKQFADKLNFLADLNVRSAATIIELEKLMGRVAKQLNRLEAIKAADEKIIADLKADNKTKDDTIKTQATQIKTLQDQVTNEALDSDDEAALEVSEAEDAAENPVGGDGAPAAAAKAAKV